MKIGIKQKLGFLFIVGGLIPVALISFYANKEASDGLERATFKLLEATNSQKKAEISRYFHEINDQVITLSHSHETIQALKEFSLSFKNYNNERNLSDMDVLALKKDLKKYYELDFGKKYKEDNTKKDLDVDSYLNALDEKSISLQHSYIKANTFPLGKKDSLDFANDLTSYSKYHSYYHPVFREYQQKFGYYDIFLVDAESGHIVYSVFKELDFATSLKNGPLKNTHIAKVFEKALSSESKEKSELVDFLPYYPSYEAAAGFIASPVWDNGKKIGVLIFQMPVDRINLIMGERAGMGQTGESYLVGENKRMRSDSFLAPDRFSILSSYRLGEESVLNTVPVEKSLKGESGLGKFTNYLGQETFSAFSGLDVLGHNWAIISEMGQEEALSEVLSLRQAIIWAFGFCIVFLGALGLGVARGIGNKINSLTEKLFSDVLKLQNNSQVILATSERLSSSVYENASAIQETVSSVDEISAMVQRNADSAHSSSEVSEKSNVAATRGKKTVDEMIASIGDIANSNQEIMTQMEKSNKEISEIVSVISEIGDKTRVINDIVFQTKLLSFNASVEAARAGEHGKGFAVVAEEVGNLANMSGKAAEEISSMLEKSIKRVTEIVEHTKNLVNELVKKGKGKIEQGKETAENCGKSLDEIFQNVTSVNEMVREIANASAEQATGVNEVTKAMAQLDIVTKENAKISTEAKAKSEEIRQCSEEIFTIASELSNYISGEKSVMRPTLESQMLHGEISKVKNDAKKQKNKIELNKKREESEGKLLSLRPTVKSEKLPTNEKKSLQSYQATGTGSEIPSRDDPRFEDL